MLASRQRLGLLLVLGSAAVGLAVVPAAAIAGLPNAVIGAGKVSTVKALQNARQRTIYMSQRDRDGRSSCYGYCLNSWNPVLTGGKVFARKGSGVTQKLLGTTRRKNGTLQVTYNHHPLYTYTSDTGPGDASGQDCVDETGHYWWMVNTSGNPIKIMGCTGY
jgi:predicted lipoprotein with Yx(FWY)xxD motif